MNAVTAIYSMRYWCMPVLCGAIIIAGWQAQMTCTCTHVQLQFYILLTNLNGMIVSFKLINNYFRKDYVHIQVNN